MTSTTMTFMEYENRIIKLQEVVRLRRKYKQWRIKNIKAPPTYIPTGPFTLIKAFVGFDPLYRHKKISGFIREAERQDQDGWIFTTRPNGNRKTRWEWHRKNLELIELKYIINPDRNDLWEISNLTKFLNRREEEAQYWLHKNDYKPSLMKLLDYRQATTVKQLKQYCRDNQIVGYSKLKKAELKQLIIKTPH